MKLRVTTIIDRQDGSQSVKTSETATTFASKTELREMLANLWRGRVERGAALSAGSTRDGYRVITDHPAGKMTLEFTLTT